MNPPPAAAETVLYWYSKQRAETEVEADVS